MNFRTLLPFLMAGCGIACTSTALSQTTCNSAAITIPTSGIASVYPSEITTSGVSNALATLAVQINGFTHTFPDDVGIVIVGPNGQALLLQDGAGNGPYAQFTVSYAFSDASTVLLPNLTTWGDGTYRATSYYSEPWVNFDSPGPGTTYNRPGPAHGYNDTLSSTYAGSNGNGTWKLFVQDFISFEGGSIAGGWCITIDDQLFAHGFDP